MTKTKPDPDSEELAAVAQLAAAKRWRIAAGRQPVADPYSPASRRPAPEPVPLKDMIKAEPVIDDAQPNVFAAVVNTEPDPEDSA